MRGLPIKIVKMKRKDKKGERASRQPTASRRR
jgi:hypothetical protein